jgi:hypothetical protein
MDEEQKENAVRERERERELRHLMEHAREIRESYGHSLNAASGIMGISASSISRYETGKARPKDDFGNVYVRYLLSRQRVGSYPVLLAAIDRAGAASPFRLMPSIADSQVPGTGQEQEPAPVLTAAQEIKLARLAAIMEAESRPAPAPPGALEDLPSLVQWIIEQGGDPDNCSPELILTGALQCQRVVLADRQMALDWVSYAHPDKQRTCRQTVWEGFAEQMDNGEWGPGVDSPVMFDTEGWQRNGNHRSHAIAVKESDTPVPVYALNGCTEAMIRVIDKGTKRTDADTLRGIGVQNGSSLVAITARLMDWDTRTPVRGSKQGAPYSAQQKHAYAQSHPEVGLAIARTHLRTAHRPKYVTANTAAICYTVLARVDEPAASEFWDEWVHPSDREGLFEVLEERLERLRRGTLTTTDRCSDSVVEILATVCWAWNHWRDGTLVTQVRLPRPLSNQNFPWPH